MRIQFSCPLCKKSITCSERFAGRQFACPGCKATLSVPVPAPQPHEKPALLFPEQFASDEPPSRSRRRPSSWPRHLLIAGAFAAAMVMATIYIVATTETQEEYRQRIKEERRLKDLREEEDRQHRLKLDRIRRMSVHF